MKRLIALFLSSAIIFTGCSVQAESSSASSAVSVSYNYEETVQEPKFKGLDDPDLRAYLEEKIFSDMDGSEYIVEDISTAYVSKEYLAELAYNSQTNLYFGYTLAELDDQFQGQRYIFTPDSDGNTVVKAFEKYNESYEKALLDVAVGAGIILVSVTVIATSSLGILPTKAILAFSAKNAQKIAKEALPKIGKDIIPMIVQSVITGDTDSLFKDAALKMGEDFLWCALSGAIKASD